MRQKLFRMVWRSVNVALVASLLALVYSAGWEHSVRDYLDGFGDAIIPSNATPEQSVDAILQWMRTGPPRSAEPTPTGLAVRDPETTLNYQQLLAVCGTATNAFLNLARSADLQVRSVGTEEFVHDAAAETGFGEQQRMFGDLTYRHDFQAGERALGIDHQH